MTAIHGSSRNIEKLQIEWDLAECERLLDFVSNDLKYREMFFKDDDPRDKHHYRQFWQTYRDMCIVFLDGHSAWVAYASKRVWVVRDTAGRLHSTKLWNEGTYNPVREQLERMHIMYKWHDYRLKPSWKKWDHVPLHLQNMLLWAMPWFQSYWKSVRMSHAHPTATETFFDPLPSPSPVSSPFQQTSETSTIDRSDVSDSEPHDSSRPLPSRHVPRWKVLSPPSTPSRSCMIVTLSPTSSPTLGASFVPMDVDELDSEQEECKEEQEDYTIGIHDKTPPLNINLSLTPSPRKSLNSSASCHLSAAYPQADVNIHSRLDAKRKFLPVVLLPRRRVDKRDTAANTTALPAMTGPLVANETNMPATEFETHTRKITFPTTDDSSTVTSLPSTSITRAPISLDSVGDQESGPDRPISRRSKQDVPIGNGATALLVRARASPFNLNHLSNMVLAEVGQDRDSEKLRDAIVLERIRLYAYAYAYILTRRPKPILDGKIVNLFLLSTSDKVSTHTVECVRKTIVAAGGSIAESTDIAHLVAGDADLIVYVQQIVDHLPAHWRTVLKATQTIGLLALLQFIDKAYQGGVPVVSTPVTTQLTSPPPHRASIIGPFAGQATMLAGQQNASSASQASLTGIKSLKTTQVNVKPPKKRKKHSSQPLVTPSVNVAPAKHSTSPASIVKSESDGTLRPKSRKRQKGETDESGLNDSIFGDKTSHDSDVQVPTVPLSELPGQLPDSSIIKGEDEVAESIRDRGGQEKKLAKQRKWQGHQGTNCERNQSKRAIVGKKPAPTVSRSAMEPSNDLHARTPIPSRSARIAIVDIARLELFRAHLRVARLEVIIPEYLDLDELFVKRQGHMKDIDPAGFEEVRFKRYIEAYRQIYCGNGVRSSVLGNWQVLAGGQSGLQDLRKAVVGKYMAYLPSIIQAAGGGISSAFTETRTAFPNSHPFRIVICTTKYNQPSPAFGKTLAQFQPLCLSPLEFMKRFDEAHRSAGLPWMA